MRPPAPFVIALVAATLLPGASAAFGLLSEDPVGVTTEVAGITAAVVVGGQHLVGYEEGHRETALLTIELAGGKVMRVQEDIRVALVESSDAETFSTAIVLSPGIEFVDGNGPTRLAGAQWNGAEWNGAQWNGAEWNGAQWNGAEWNGAQWNAAHGAPAGADDPGRFKQWGLVSADVPPAWKTSTGTRDATLCVIDSGIDSDHRDIAPNLWRDATGSFGYNALDPSAPPEDDAGHGTHVAGIAAATTGNGWGVAGVSNVRIMSVKVLDAEGSGTEGDLAWGIAWCANNGADVALMALSVTQPGPALDRAIQYAASLDVVLVASAGNTGADVAYPGRHPAVIGVAAVNVSHARASFSSRGPAVDLAAPGVDILSTFVDGRFVYGTGTSQAAAWVAGAAALLRDGQPGETAATTRAALESTARDLGSAGKDAAYGHGLVDVEAALRASRAP